MKVKVEMRNPADRAMGQVIQTLSDRLQLTGDLGEAKAVVTDDVKKALAFLKAGKFVGLALPSKDIDQAAGLTTAPMFKDKVKAVPLGSITPMIAWLAGIAGQEEGL